MYTLPDGVSLLLVDECDDRDDCEAIWWTRAAACRHGAGTESSPIRESR